MQSKPQFNYTILHRIGKKELAIKAIYFTFIFAYIFINTLLKYQWMRIIKGLPLELYN
jgi:lipid II:glycine glycyltransferase (peptidoglycan interpeptide bridge formation enzyme)